MKAGIGHSASERVITAEMVHAAYLEANPEWNAPSDTDCEAIANALEFYRGGQLALKQLQIITSEPDAAGRKRLRQRDEVRKAIGTLLKHLPPLVEWAPGHVTLPGSLHANSLVELLDATRKTAFLWPDLNGGIKRFDRRTGWALSADTWVGMILRAWRKANPNLRRPIGKPLAPDQPMTRLMVIIIEMVVAEPVSAEQVSKHFERTKSAFVITDLAEAGKTSDKFF